tara:strand:+ start:51 stop:479 length:429 start_codon:yes stop_codon:yes gene_type:complete
MKQLREHIKKTISTLMEAKYPAPEEIIMALRKDLKLNPLIRYVNTLKAANTVPPSYEVRLLNGNSFMIYYEDFSLMVKIGTKKYYLGDDNEKLQARNHINRLLTDPIRKTPEDTEGEDEETLDSSSEPTEEPTEEPAEEPEG